MFKRSRNDSTLGEVIKEFIAAYHLSDKLNEVNFRQYWENVCGEVVARHTLKMYINKRKLFVRVDSAALRNELSMSRTHIADALNKEAGAQVIDEVVFL
jgi:predicted nucleic acid-binding Zn ribbon protein